MFPTNEYAKKSREINTLITCNIKPPLLRFHAPNRCEMGAKALVPKRCPTDRPNCQFLSLSVPKSRP